MGWQVNSESITAADNTVTVHAAAPSFAGVAPLQQLPLCVRWGVGLSAVAGFS